MESLARMVRCRTVSSRDNPEAVDQSQFEAFHRLLEERYPLVHRTCTREFVGKNGILYHWKGKTPGDPTVLMAHYDVVPVVEAEWEKPPFSGHPGGWGALGQGHAGYQGHPLRRDGGRGIPVGKGVPAGA